MIRAEGGVILDYARLTQILGAAEKTLQLAGWLRSICSRIEAHMFAESEKQNVPN